MAPADPLDSSTLDAPRRRRAAARVPAARVVFRAREGIVLEPSRRLPEGAILVGRGVGPAGIDLGDDPLASREHAAIVRRPASDEVIVEDRGSRNGVNVNGRRVPRTSLVDGDVVRIGSSFLVFRAEDPRQIDVPDDLLGGLSPALQALRVAVHRAAPSGATVLVEGETGTGKEVVAQALHAKSKRSGPFVAVNCAAIAESLAESQLFGHVAGAFTGARGPHPGFFCAADGGTLFLDEIGELPLALQPKLLRALESRAVVPLGAVTPRPFDARIVAATNVRVAEAVERGAFRADLFARIAQLRLEIPPLRARREDILALVVRRLPEDAPPLSPDLVEALLVHRWPYNVRELFSVVTELGVWGRGAERLDVDLVRDRLSLPSDDGEAASQASPDPPGDAPRAPGDPTSPEPPSVASLEALLAKHGGNVAAIAREVGRSRTQVYRWMTQFGLDPTRYRPDPT
jgi:transcriptional regulator with PAS, ATPase and Fis domain